MCNRIFYLLDYFIKTDVWKLWHLFLAKQTIMSGFFLIENNADHAVNILGRIFFMLEKYFYKSNIYSERNFMLFYWIAS